MVGRGPSLSGSSLSRRQLLAVCGTTALAGCSGKSVPVATRDSSPDEWPSSRYGARNTSYNPEASPPRSDPEVRWSQTAARGTSSAEGNPIVVNDRVLFATRDRLVALSTDDGSRVWAYAPESDGDVEFQPTAAGETVFLGGPDKTLHALATADGTRRWTARAADWGWIEHGGNVPVKSPTVAGGRVCAPCRGNLYFFDGTGTPTWRTHISDTRPNPAMVGDTLYSVGDVVLSAIRVDEPTSNLWRSNPSVDLEEFRQWTFLAPGRAARIAGTPALVDGTAYTSVWPTGENNASASLFAIDAADGTTQWRYETPAGMHQISRPTVADGTAFIGGDGVVYAIDAEQGTRRWRATADGFVFSLVAGGRTLVISGESTVTAFDVQSGEQLWRRSLSSYVTGLSVAADTLFAATAESAPKRVRIHALR